MPFRSALAANEITSIWSNKKSTRRRDETIFLGRRQRVEMKKSILISTATKRFRSPETDVPVSSFSI